MDGGLISAFVIAGFLLFVAGFVCGRADNKAELRMRYGDAHENGPFAP